MTAAICKQLEHDLLIDLHYFVHISIPVVLFLVFFTVGAKIMEMKGYQKWPAVFAVLPLFWILMGWFDPRPEKSGAFTQRLSWVFTFLNIASITFAILYI